jgi:hypothetical protein
MNQDYVLGKLSNVMGWDTDRSRDEFAWLRLMSRIKYDGYQDFLAGMRFIESLMDWIQQFKPEERETAYQFVRNALVYIGPLEMSHLVELFYPEVVQRKLMQETAARLSIKRHQVWANSDAIKLYKTLLRQTLFIELSDGARIDIFRRANAGVISNEQIVTAPRILRAKWDDLLKDLREELKDESARFAFVYVVDDFIGSCTTLLRKETGGWTGKLFRFWEDLKEVGVQASHLQDDWQLCVHHYVASHQATIVAQQRQAEALKERTDSKDGWFDRVDFTYGMVLPRDLPITAEQYGDFLKLVETYYDDSIETKHLKKGGDNARLGFGHCALPLVLDHNTPNNSIALLWAESVGGPGKHAMRPLFRRRQRHL